MKKYILRLLAIIVFFFFLKSCGLLDFIFKKEIRVLKSETWTHEEAQLAIIKELYDFYANSDKSYEFYEVKWRGYMLNYNTKYKTLNLAFDACSGWATQFMDVSEEDLKQLAESNLPFDKYSTLFKSNPNSHDWSMIRTHGCMGDHIPWNELKRKMRLERESAK